MNSINFIFISVALTFATGFFVAAIIWGINYVITSKKGRSSFAEFLNLFQSVSREEMKDELSIASGGNISMSTEESRNNEELYSYHHGEN